jgi:hypothetical protein
MRAIIFFNILLLTPFAVFAQGASQLQLERIGGSVELFRGSQGTLIQREYALKEGDVVRVAMEGRARVAAQNAKIDLGEGSIIKIERSQKNNLIEANLLFGNFRVEGSKFVIKLPNLGLSIHNGIFYTHVFGSEGELGRSLSGQGWDQPPLSEAFSLASKPDTYSHINCLEGRADVIGRSDLSVKSEELFRAVGQVLDPVTRKIGRDAILASVRQLGFL